MMFHLFAAAIIALFMWKHPAYARNVERAVENFGCRVATWLCWFALWINIGGAIGTFLRGSFWI
jgi:hypothetical protein